MCNICKRRKDLQAELVTLEPHNTIVMCKLQPDFAHVYTVLEKVVSTSVDTTITCDLLADNALGFSGFFAL